MSLPTTATVARPRAFGFGARIDDVLVRLAVSPTNPLDIITAPLQAPAVNTAQSPEEMRNEFGQIFSRSDFTGGEGLAFAHRRNAAELDAVRFWASEHVAVTPAVPGEPPKLRLLAPTANIETSADTALQLAFDGTNLFMLEGTTARTSSTFTGATPTFSSINPWDTGGDVAAAVLDVASLGTDLYFACGANGIHKRVFAGTLSSLSATACQRVWTAKRQLLAATTSASVLNSVALAGGALTVLVTLSTGQTWLDVCDAGEVILAAASDGAVYALGFDSSGAAGGVLQLKSQTPVGVGEVPYAVGSDGDSVFYATREATVSGAIGRWYRATLTQQFALTDVTLLRTWGDQSTTVDSCPRAIRSTRDAVFCGVQEDDGRCFLWRYDRITAGVTRHLDLGTGGLVVDLLAVAGRLFATVAGAGLRREQVGTFETSGWLMGPLADFFTAADKSWAGALMDADTIEDDCRLRLYFTVDPTALEDPDASSWIEVKNVSSSRDDTESPIINVAGRALAGMVRLDASSDITTTPAVRSFSFRAYPGDGDLQVTLPVVCGDTIERAGFQRRRVSGQGEALYGALKGREGTYVELELFRPPMLLRGVIEQIGARLQAITAKGAPTDVVLVKFRGRPSTVGTAVSSASGALWLSPMPAGGWIP